MKRLFCVMDRKTGKRHYFEGAGNSPYFDSKQKAKELRNHLLSEEKDKTRYYIAKGPDHIGTHSGYGVPRMRRQPKSKA